MTKDIEIKQFDTVNLTIQENGVAIIEFNRPKQLNAIDEQVTFDFPSACKLAEENCTVKVVVITGAGKAFSSGGDISVLSAIKNVIRAKDTFDRSMEIVKAVYEMRKPVIAAVNGPVAGASLATMMACDIIIAADTSVFGFSFIQLGFAPDSGTSYFLTRKVGYHKACEILWYGKSLNIEEANALGLVNKVVPVEECLTEALRWAEKLIQQPAMAVSWDKTLLRASLKNDFYEQADMESMYQLLAWSSPDFTEGATAFIEKRKPVFNQKEGL